MNPEILKRYWTDQCTEDEKLQVREWLALGEPDNDYPLSDDLDELEEKQILLEGITARIRKWDRPGNSMTTNWFKTIGIAASLLLICFIVLYGAYSGMEHPVPFSAYLKVAVPYGEKRILTLGDGTVVHLNSGSTLSYPAHFEKTRRHVLLKGEAYFVVAKNPEKPFIVETAHTSARVLGTHFNIREFSGDKNASIVVEEGRVQFSGAGCTDTLILTAGKRAIFAGAAMQKSTDPTFSFLAWKNNILHFDDVPLATAIPEIERWFNVSIGVRDKAIYELRIKGSFNNPSLTGLLDDLSYLMNLKYRTEKNKVSLYR